MFTKNLSMMRKLCHLCTFGSMH